jgi:hypothetical protein
VTLISTSVALHSQGFIQASNARVVMCEAWCTLRLVVSIMVQKRVSMKLVGICWQLQQADGILYRWILV